jgi:hypothetical protein
LARRLPLSCLPLESRPPPGLSEAVNAYELLCESCLAKCSAKEDFEKYDDYWKLKYEKFDQRKLLPSGEVVMGICFGLVVRWFEELFRFKAPFFCLTGIKGRISSAKMYQQIRETIKPKQGDAWENFSAPVVTTLAKLKYSGERATERHEINSAKRHSMSGFVEELFKVAPTAEVHYLLSFEMLSDSAHACGLYVDVGKGRIALFDPNLGLWEVQSSKRFDDEKKLDWMRCGVNKVLDALMCKSKTVGAQKLYTRVGATKCGMKRKF